MTSLSEKLRELLGKPVIMGSAAETMALDDQSLQRLMHLLCDTRDDELSCEEVFNCLDEYVDCLEASHDVDGKRSLVEHHLSICSDCRDELDALVHALENASLDSRTTTEPPA